MYAEPWAAKYDALADAEYQEKSLYISVEDIPVTVHHRRMGKLVH